MTFVVGASAHGSPGVSTALGLMASQWSDSDAVPVVVEADASGGVLAARYELSLTPGFVSLAESLRKFESPPLLDHAQRLPSGVACVPLSPSATAASAQLRSAGAYMGPYLATSGHPVMLDAGTVVPDSKVVASLTSADLLLWFVRPTREELLVLRHRLAECSQPEHVGIVLVGDKPYNAEQVSEALGVEVLHTLRVDPRGAAAANMGGDDRYLRRSQLTRSCSQLTSIVQARLALTAKAPLSLPAPAPSPPPTQAPSNLTHPPPPNQRPPSTRPEPSAQSAPPLEGDPFTQTTPSPPATEEVEELAVWTRVEDESEASADPTLVVWVNDDQD